MSTLYPAVISKNGIFYCYDSNLESVCFSEVIEGRLTPLTEIDEHCEHFRIMLDDDCDLIGATEFSAEIEDNNIWLFDDATNSFNIQSLKDKVMTISNLRVPLQCMGAFLTKLFETSSFNGIRKIVVEFHSFELEVYTGDTENEIMSNLRKIVATVGFNHSCYFCKNHKR